jgi:UDP-N-acetylmuramate--alanine ligase
MRVLAKLCAERGYTVTGSDRDCTGEGALSLSLAGIRVSLPSEDGDIVAADLAVYSLAVGKDHPELRAAREWGIPLASRADLLGALMGDYREAIGIAGTHGKSTVTAMLGAVLAALGRDPTVAAGAPLSPCGDGYRKGGRELFVFEACEYRASFLSCAPTVALLTNAEWDHPDCFPDRASALAAFQAYLALPSVRLAVLSADDPGTRELTAQISVPYVTFGLSEGADVRALRLTEREGCYAFTLSVLGREVGEVSLSVPGLHNVGNALAASAAALAVGCDGGGIPAALSAFRGIGRRLEYRGRYRGVPYYDDYAHHPTEIRAALSALKGGEGRVICLFQPHTYTRTAALFSELCAALSEADLAVLVDIYAAREENTSGVSSRALARAIGAVYFPSPEAASLFVRGEAREGDRVVVMGAGDIGARVFCGVLSFGGGHF